MHGGHTADRPCWRVLGENVKLSGSLFVRNAIQYDYCVLESIQSLLGVCDEVVVLECSSDDDTLKLLRSIRSPKLRLLSDAHWECALDCARLSRLANLAKSFCSHPMHFMLQADEVIHEKSYDRIRYWCKLGNGHTVSVRRWNFYGDPFRHVKIDIPLSEKPCDDHPTRLGLSTIDALGDGESIEKINDVLDDEIIICHYGFVRDRIKLVRRTVATLEWFHYPPQPDQRFSAMLADGEYRYRDIMRDDQLTNYTGTHPKVIMPWLEERWPRK